MSNYTEKKSGVSSFATGCIPECECGCGGGTGCFDGSTTPGTDGPWSFLDDWDSWSDEEKTSIFVPYIEYVNNSQTAKDDMGSEVNKAAAKRLLKYHTFVHNITFQLTSNSQIITQIAYEPIYNAIPTGPLHDKLTAWAKSKGIAY